MEKDGIYAPKMSWNLNTDESIEAETERKGFQMRKRSCIVENSEKQRIHVQKHSLTPNIHVKSGMNEIKDKYSSYRLKEAGIKEGENIILGGRISKLNKKRATPRTVPTGNFTGSLGDVGHVDSPSPIEETTKGSFGNLVQLFKNKSLAEGKSIESSITPRSNKLSIQEKKVFINPLTQGIQLFQPPFRNGETLSVSKKINDRLKPISHALCRPSVVYGGGITYLNTPNIPKSTFNIQSPVTRVIPNSGDIEGLNDIPLYSDNELFMLEEHPLTLHQLAQSLIKETNLNSEFLILKELGLRMDMPITIAKIWCTLEQKNSLVFDKSKKLLILDLDNINTQRSIDNTLIQIANCNNGLSEPQSRSTIYYTKENEYSFYLRPFSIEFLKNMNKLYNIVIFTAADADYAQSILNRIENLAGEELILCIYSKNHLGKLENGFPVKRLIENYEESKTIVVDDSFMSWFHCPRNFVPIRPFRGYSKDISLLTLGAYLRELGDVFDVRKVNDTYIHLLSTMTQALA